MDENTAATREQARRIIAACVPDEIEAFDEKVDGLLAMLPKLSRSGASREKPTSFGGPELYPLFHLAVLLADYLRDALPGAVLEFGISRGVDSLAERRRARRRPRAGQEPADEAGNAASAPEEREELLSLQIDRIRGEHPGTVVQMKIGGSSYPTAAETAVLLGSFVAAYAASGGEPTQADEAS